ncbi:hypothetical protein BT69DRAFT_1323353 [Atractiella rhizophila]|nr:hypothetical protein BT69DRAFT_1323353 [Atractiella rhizophila]
MSSNYTIRRKLGAFCISATNTALGPNAGWNITYLQGATNNTTPQLLGGMVHTRGPRLFGLLWRQVEVLAPVTYQSNRGFIEVLDAQRAGEGSPEVRAISGFSQQKHFSTFILKSVHRWPSVSPWSHTTSIEDRDIKLVPATYIPYWPFTAFATWICWDVWRSARISVTKNDLDEGQLLETGAERLSEGSEEEVTKVSAMRIRLGTRKDGGYGIVPWD